MHLIAKEQEADYNPATDYDDAMTKIKDANIVPHILVSVPKALIYDPSLTDQDRKFYLFLRDVANSDGEAWPSHKTIQKRLNISARTLARRLERLTAPPKGNGKSLRTGQLISTNKKAIKLQIGEEVRDVELTVYTILPFPYPPDNQRFVKFAESLDKSADSLCQQWQDECAKNGKTNLPSLPTVSNTHPKVSNTLKASKTLLSKEEDICIPSDTTSIPYHEIIADLNSVTGQAYKPGTKGTRKLIHARWAEGFRLPDFKTVHRKKAAEWIDTDYQQYLTPSTLYGSKFEGYLNQPEKHNRPKKEEEEEEEEERKIYRSRWSPGNGFFSTSDRDEYDNGPRGQDDKAFLDKGGRFYNPITYCFREWSEEKERWIDTDVVNEKGRARDQREEEQFQEIKHLLPPITFPPKESY